MRKLSVLFLFIFLLNGCSKDHNSPNDQSQEPGQVNPPGQENLPDGGTIKISQLVIINHENLNQNEYSGKLGETDIKLVKTSDNELTFKVPNKMALGKQVLNIPGLNNLKIKYQITDLEITGTAEENLSTYFSNTQTYLSSIDGTPDFEYVSGYFDRLKDAYRNLSESDKLVMAKYYKANQSRFDKILTTDFSGREMLSGLSLKLLSKYQLATIAFGVSAAVAIIDPEFSTKAIATGVCIIAWKKAKDYNEEFLDQNIKVLNLAIDNLLSSIDHRPMGNVLEIKSGIASVFPFKYNSRSVIDSDRGDNNENIKTYFSEHFSYNSIIDKVNDLITFINENFFLADFDLLPKSEIKTSDTGKTNSPDRDFFDRLTFSLDNNNLSIDDVSLNNGKLNIAVRIINPCDVDDFAGANLHFSYNDDFNNVSGYFPIKVSKENTGIDLSGNWRMVLQQDCSYYKNLSNYFNTIIFNRNNTWNEPANTNWFGVTNTYTLLGSNLTINYSMTGGGFFLDCNNDAQDSTGNGYETKAIQTTLMTSKLVYDCNSKSFRGTYTLHDIQKDCDLDYDRTCSGTITITKL